MNNEQNNNQIIDKTLSTFNKLNLWINFLTDDNKKLIIFLSNSQIENYCIQHYYQNCGDAIILELISYEITQIIIHDFYSQNFNVKFNNLEHNNKDLQDLNCNLTIASTINNEIQITILIYDLDLYNKINQYLVWTNFLPVVSAENIDLNIDILGSYKLTNAMKVDHNKNLYLRIPIEFNNICSKIYLNQSLIIHFVNKFLNTYNDNMQAVELNDAKATVIQLKSYFEKIFNCQLKIGVIKYQYLIPKNLIGINCICNNFNEIIYFDHWIFNNTNSVMSNGLIDNTTIIDLPVEIGMVKISYQELSTLACGDIILLDNHLNNVEQIDNIILNFGGLGFLAQVDSTQKATIVDFAFNFN